MVPVTPLVVDDLAVAIVLGTAFGAGVLLMLTRVPRWAAPSLTRRIAPYLRDVTDPAGLTPVGALSAPATMPVVSSLGRRLAALAGSNVAVERRLRQAAWTTDAVTFRARQLAWGLAGLAAGAAAAVGISLAGRGSAALVLLPPLAAVGAMAAVDAVLSRAAAARLARIGDELPTVLEFLALCLSAGEGILDSLRRVSDVGAGELTGELRALVVAVGTGSSLPDELGALSARLEVAAVTRAVDQLVAAIDRGAPLAQVLHAQALDAREDAKRTLIERAGRKEIYMLVPLVFLILPLSVLFAVFPGIFILRLGLG
ncbi:Bacterial type II secretion system protein F domain protein [Microbacterium terrae]|uniref:Bacterial type II secretion system protein F domain protein n=1 Tax=Microbacterium terrae TaxID=69369 RepID=A0A0M2HK84_9MICO|nr:Bacterial type II secretion system protein F domain protein [Microbacterium terrae]